MTAAVRLAVPVAAIVAAVVAMPVQAQAQGPAQGQARADRGVVLADSIRVGDVVPIAVRIVVDPGERASLPDTLPLGSPDLENAARVRERTDTLEDGRVQLAALYAVTPWRPGTAELPELSVRIAAADGAVRDAQVPLPAFEVLSVLPADADVLEPMPAKGVIGPSFAWWPFALALLALLVLGALAWRWVRRDRPVAAAPLAPAVPPRARALAVLEHARDAGFIERGEWKEFYTQVSHALREYVDAIEPAWGEDLTTSELLARVRADAGPEEAAALARLLRPADQVKFARRIPVADEAMAEWEDARRWVERFDWPPRPATVEAAA